MKTQARTQGKLSYKKHYYENYFILGCEDTESGLRYADEVKDIGLHVGTAETQANAEHLARCWNSHEELVDIVKDYRQFLIGYIQGEEDSHQGANNMISKITQALNNASK